MSSAISPRSLYSQYFDDFGATPQRAEHFMSYCKKNGTKLRYKDCMQLLKNPPTEMNGEHIPSSAPSRRNSVQVSQYSDDEEYEEHSHNTPSSESHKPSSSQSDSPAAIAGLKSMIYATQTAQRNSHSHSNGFHKLDKMDLPNTIRVSLDSSSYISPEILIDETIPIKDEQMNIRSYHRDLSELHIRKYPLCRDCILFLLYWLSLINGYLQLYTFNLWYFRFVCFFIWICCVIIGVLCHMYGRSPPFYPMFRGSDTKYITKFDTSAAQYINEWNRKQYVKPQRNGTNVTEETVDPDDGTLLLSMKLFHIEMFGGFIDSKCGFVDINAQRIENKSIDILDDIAKHRNTLIRLRVFHILRFHNDSSYQKFVEMLRVLKGESFGAIADQMFHIQYNVEFEQRLLMNSTHGIKDGNGVCSKWNKCCANRRLSYLWYLSGFGFLYRFYHDCCIKTHVYDCIKEVTL